MSLLSICNIVLLFLVIVLLFLVLLYFNAERFYYFYLRLREESPPILKIVDPDAIHLNDKAIWIERFKEKLKILIPILIFIAIIAMGPYILNFAVLAIWTAPGIYYIITEDALGIVSVTATVVFPLVWDRIWEYQPHQTRINRQNYVFISSAWLFSCQYLFIENAK